MTSPETTRLTEWGALWMIRLRWLAVAAILLAPAYGGPLGFPVPVTYFVAIGLLVALYNALFTWWFRKRGAPSERLTHVQMVADLVALTAVFWMAGGARNPLLPVYGFHVVLSAIMLSRRASFLYATLATALASTLVQRPPLTGELVPDARSPWVTLAATAVVLFLLAYLASVLGGVLHQREARLLELTRTLAEQDRRKSQYVLMLGHGMLSRVEDIAGAIRTATRDLPPGAPESLRGMLSRASAWLDGLHALVRDVVELSRIRASGEMNFSYTYLPRILYEQAQNLQARARERNVSIQVEAPDGVPPIQANAKALSQVVENLLRNAIAYSSSGGTVRMAIHETDGAIELVVEDRGIGISSEEQPHLFEEFYRGARARERERTGTGLGLAIVKYVVEQHGGSVAVESEEGKGSRFVVRLPRASQPGRTAADGAARDSLSGLC